MFKWAEDRVGKANSKKKSHFLTKLNKKSHLDMVMQHVVYFMSNVNQKQSVINRQNPETVYIQ